MEVKDKTPDYVEVSDRLRLLAHPERLRILDAIRRDAECVCHLEALLDKPQPYVSQQLRLLRDGGLIVDEKMGQNVYYRLVNTEVRAWLASILGPAAGEIPEMARHKNVIACPCPKCAVEAHIPAPVVIELVADSRVTVLPEQVIS
jgi:ArsR family transcriptional regulator